MGRDIRWDAGNFSFVGYHRGTVRFCKFTKSVLEVNVLLNVPFYGANRLPHVSELLMMAQDD